MKKTQIFLSKTHVLMFYIFFPMNCLKNVNIDDKVRKFKSFQLNFQIQIMY